MPPKKKSADASRLGFVDDTRGIAVVLMIFWHTVDGWLLPAMKVGQRFEVMRSFGGLAAPMFLFLAGAGAALKIAADAARGTPRHKTILELTCRGLEVVVSGYALRVFMWVVDGTAIAEPDLLPAYGPLALGLAAMYVGLGRVSTRARLGIPLVVAGAVVWAIGWWQTSIVLPEQVVRLGRVDVLQTIGFSLVFIAWTEPLFGYAKRPYLGIPLGILLASLTGFFERGLPGGLHPCVAAYLGRWNSGVGPSVAMFPLFPWLGYAACGTTIGVVWFRGERAGRTALTVLGVACLGALVGSITNENIEGTHAVIRQAPELARAVRMVQKIGFALALSGVSYIVTQRVSRFPMRTLGNTSMFIYWVHLELVYGIVARDVSHALDLWSWAIGFAILTLLMAIVAEARVRAPHVFTALTNRMRVPSREG